MKEYAFWSSFSLLLMFFTRRRWLCVACCEPIFVITSCAGVALAGSQACIQQDGGENRKSKSEKTCGLK